MFQVSHHGTRNTPGCLYSPRGPNPVCPPAVVAVLNFTNFQQMSAWLDWCSVFGRMDAIEHASLDAHKPGMLLSPVYWLASD
jgi:hypothetical protein